MALIKNKETNVSLNKNNDEAMDTFNSAYIVRVNKIRRQMSDGETDINNFYCPKKTTRVGQSKANINREISTKSRFGLLTAEVTDAGSSKHNYKGKDQRVEPPTNPTTNIAKKSW